VKVNRRQPSSAKSILVSAVLALGLVAFGYGAVQHDMRMSANDPQIQISEDGANKLAAGAGPESLTSGLDQVDVAKSLSPMVAVYAANQSLLATNGTIDGRTPQLPNGLLAYVRAHGQDRFTWQPTPSVRLAAVVTRDTKTGGYVLAARNLREVERRESDIAAYGVITAACILAVSVIALVV
jgi:hypothetical protein